MTPDQKRIAEQIIAEFRKQNNVLNTILLDQSLFKDSHEKNYIIGAMKELGLIESKDDHNLKGIHRLTQKGVSFTTFEEEEQIQFRKEEQLKMKHWYDTENAKQQFEDYPATKRRALQSIWIAWIAVLIAVLTFICNKSH